MTAIPDPIEALRSFLLADNDVAALIDTRLFGGEVPEGTEMPQACVVLNPAGGGLIGRAYQNYGDGRVDVYCYGATLNEAHAVYLAVKQALKHLRREVWESVLLHWARMSSGGASGRDPVTQWPVSLSSWQVLTSETAAT